MLSGSTWALTLPQRGEGEPLNPQPKPPSAGAELEAGHEGGTHGHSVTHFVLWPAPAQGRQAESQQEERKLLQKALGF